MTPRDYQAQRYYGRKRQLEQRYDAAVSIDIRLFVWCVVAAILLAGLLQAICAFFNWSATTGIYALLVTWLLLWGVHEYLQNRRVYLKRRKIHDQLQRLDEEYFRHTRT